MSLLEVASLSVSYQTRRGRIRAVDDVSFALERGRWFGEGLAVAERISNSLRSR